MDIKKELEKMSRNMIRVDIEEKADYICGATRFGGIPDVPVDFVWPVYETVAYNDDELKLRPLSFIAQFNCAELALLDKERLCLKQACFHFAMRWIHSYGGLIQRMRSVHVYIGLMKYHHQQLQNPPLICQRNFVSRNLK